MNFLGRITKCSLEMESSPRRNAVGSWRRYHVEIRTSKLLSAVRATFSVGDFRNPPPGRPDLAFVSSRVAVFVDGCFSQGCPLHGTRPKVNAIFWANKIETNKLREANVDRHAEELGWQPIRVWEHEILPDPSNAAMRIWAVVRSRSST